MRFGGRGGEQIDDESIEIVRHKSPVTRRAVLGAIGTAGLAALAGCTGDDEQRDDDSETNFREAWPPREARVGGTLSVAVPFEPPGHDPAAIRSAGQNMVTHLIYDGLVQLSNRGGETYNWLAKSIEQSSGSADYWPVDYLDYATPYEIAAIEQSEPRFDLDESNHVLAIHPDDKTAFADGELAVGDSMRLLTRTEASEAASDGVHATKVGLTLWEGVYFHDGEELTAGNVVDSYDRIAASDLAAEQFDSLLAVEAPNGPDGYDITLYAQRPVIRPGISLQPLTIFPSTHLDLSLGELDPDGSDIPIGCGPYEVEQWDSDEVRLVKNEEYWLQDIELAMFDWWEKEDYEPPFPEAPLLDEIRIEAMPDYEARYDAITSNDVHLTFDFTPEDLTKFQQQEGEFDELGVGAVAGSEMITLQMPVAADSETPLAVQECRQAIAAAISRKELYKSVNKWAGPAHIPVPPRDSSSKIDRSTICLKSRGPHHKMPIWK